MIIRFSLFLVLLASFYYYCNDGSAPGPLNSPNDMNMIEVPKDFQPEFRHDMVLEAWLSPDSTVYLNSQNSQFHKSQLELASALR